MAMQSILQWPKLVKMNHGFSARINLEINLFYFWFVFSLQRILFFVLPFKYLSHHWTLSKLCSLTAKLIHVLLLKKKKLGTSLVVQWLRLHASTTVDRGSIPWGTRILHATWLSQKKKKNKEKKIKENNKSTPAPPTHVTFSPPIL